ncbi:hypothetical protein CALCODRAFT_404560, partial [Calocera cornea HHB12733]
AEIVSQLSARFDRLCSRIHASIRLDQGVSARLLASRREVLDYWKAASKLYQHLSTREISLLQNDFDLMLKAIDSAFDKESDPIPRQYPLFVTPHLTGRRGRPQLNIHTTVLQDLVPGRSKAGIARRLGVSARTLQRRLQSAGLARISAPAFTFQRNARGVVIGRRRLPIVRPTSSLSNPQLDRIVRRWRLRHENNGPGMLKGHLLSLGYNVSLARLRLIRWKFVTHAFIDGYSRCIVSIRVSDNNRADSVLDVFHAARTQFGTPSRV